MDDQLLDLALMTNYSQSTFMLLARCHYQHRSNIVWLGQPTVLYPRNIWKLPPKLWNIKTQCNATFVFLQYRNVNISMRENFMALIID